MGVPPNHPVGMTPCDDRGSPPKKVSPGAQLKAAPRCLRVSQAWDPSGKFNTF